ncbi:ATP-binding protein [Streptomyces sodiiphilus]
MDSRSDAPPQRAVPPPPPREGAWRFTVAPAEASVPQIRRAVRELLRRQQVPVSDDLLQGLLLILTELVTNGIRHAALLTPRIGVEVAVDDRWVRVAVEDGHPYRPKALEQAPALENTSGRGLLLVKVITAEAGGRCGVEPTAVGGKTVWAALPLDRIPRMFL